MFDIYVDSAANIPAEQVSKYGINVIPFMSMCGDEVIPGFTPGLTPEEERAVGKKFYDRMRAGDEINTSLVNTDKFEEEFKKSLDEGKDVLYISLSANISGTYNAARVAAEELLEEYPDRYIALVDSMNACLGQGLIGVYAAIYREEGKDVKETEKLLKDMVPRMNGVFTVGNLNHIARTGRITKATAMLGNVMDIKPLLKGSKDGFIVSFKKCRGRKKALEALVDIVVDNIVDPENQIFGIAHADAYEDTLWMTEKILEKIKVKEVMNATYDFCTGAHAGPDTIAVFYIGKDREPV